MRRRRTYRWKYISSLGVLQRRWSLSVWEAVLGFKSSPAGKSIYITKSADSASDNLGGRRPSFWILWSSIFTVLGVISTDCLCINKRTSISSSVSSRCEPPCRYFCWGCSAITSTTIQYALMRSAYTWTSISSVWDPKGCKELCAHVVSTVIRWIWWYHKYCTFMSHHLPAWSQRTNLINTQGLEHSAFFISFSERDNCKNRSFTIVSTGGRLDASLCVLGAMNGRGSIDVTASISASSEIFRAIDLFVDSILSRDELHWSA